MEDEHVLLTGPGWAALAVLDGHNGPECSRFAARMLQERLRGGPPPDADACRQLCLEVETAFLAAQLEGGSTLSLVVARRQSAARWGLLCAGLGDSRALLVRGGAGCEALLQEHSAGLPSEQERIRSAGGSVAEVDGVWRVLTGKAMLAMTRCFGDAELKREGAVTADPDVTEAEAADGDTIIVCTDGLFDHGWDPPAIGDFVRARIDPADPAKAAAAAVAYAVPRGTGDNTTCIVAVLGAEAAPDAPAEELRLGPFEHWRDAGFRVLWLHAAAWGGGNAECCLARWGLAALAELRDRRTRSGVRELCICKGTDGKVGINHQDLVVHRVTAGSGAQRGGVRPGMRLLSIAGEAIESPARAMAAFAAAPPEFTLTVQEEEADGDEESPQSSAHSAAQRLGASMQQSLRLQSGRAAVRTCGALERELAFWALGDALGRSGEAVVAAAEGGGDVDSALAALSSACLAAAARGVVSEWT